MKTETVATWTLSFVAVILAAMIACRVTMIYGHYSAVGPVTQKEVIRSNPR